MIRLPTGEVESDNVRISLLELSYDRGSESLDEV